MSWLGYVAKLLDNKDKVNFKFYDVTAWLTNNRNAHIAQYFDIWSVGGCFTWNFIPEWNSSQDEIIPAYGKMSHTVYTFLPKWNFIPGWTHPGMKFDPCLSLGWNFKMSMFFFIFDVCIQVCFPNSTCLNRMKVRI